LILFYLLGFLFQILHRKKRVRIHFIGPDIDGIDSEFHQNDHHTLSIFFSVYLNQIQECSLKRERKE